MPTDRTSLARKRIGEWDEFFVRVQLVKAVSTMQHSDAPGIEEDLTLACSGEGRTSLKNRLHLDVYISDIPGTAGPAETLGA